jgi:isopentenyl diphosphate isomerase/L-lactate dehydrogenase-like FMN-dependent dehydrogenase
MLWGLIAAEAEGAQHVLELHCDEFTLAMALAGHPILAYVDVVLVCGYVQ